MTNREEIILHSVLAVLKETEAAMAEGMIQAGVQSRLGASITLAELDAALKVCDEQRLATGLPGKFGKRRWMITDTGAHTLSQLNQ